MKKHSGEKTLADMEVSYLCHTHVLANDSRNIYLIYLITLKMSNM